MADRGEVYRQAILVIFTRYCRSRDGMGDMSDEDAVISCCYPCVRLIACKRIERVFADGGES